MKPKTEEFLYFLLWTCEMLIRPTFRNVTDSFESWAYRNGFHRQLAELERRKLLQRVEAGQGDRTRLERALRLTEAGRLHALGGRDPEACWRRPWDGKWRLVLFDVPNTRGVVRDRLRHSLRQNGFGFLQNSVWISPHPLDLGKDALAGANVDVGSLTFFEARPCAGETDEELVAGAWDFPLINRLYSKHLKVLANRPVKPINDAAAAEAFRQWAGKERTAWGDAVSRDPLLPEMLLPNDYLGRTASNQRLAAFQATAPHLRSFKPPCE